MSSMLRVRESHRFRIQSHLTRNSKLTMVLVALSAFCFAPLALFAQKPALFYSDLTQGPAGGGENGNGVYVTLGGYNLGLGSISTGSTTPQLIQPGDGGACGGSCSSVEGRIWTPNEHETLTISTSGAVYYLADNPLEVEGVGSTLDVSSTAGAANANLTVSTATTVANDFVYSLFNPQANQSEFASGWSTINGWPAMDAYQVKSTAGTISAAWPYAGSPVPSVTTPTDASSTIAANSYRVTLEYTGTSGTLFAGATTPVTISTSDAYDIAVASPAPYAGPGTFGSYEIFIQTGGSGNYYYQATVAVGTNYTRTTAPATSGTYASIWAGTSNVGGLIAALEPSGTTGYANVFGVSFCVNSGCTSGTVPTLSWSSVAGNTCSQIVAPTAVTENTQTFYYALLYCPVASPVTTGITQASGAQVLLDNTPVSAIKTWTNTKIQFQIPSTAAAGLHEIRVAIPGYGVSNPLPFTVTSTGSIYCVSPSGLDTNPGTFSGGCWQTLPHAAKYAPANSYIYDAANATVLDPLSGCHTAVNWGYFCSGTYHYAYLMAYPGTFPILGDSESSTTFQPLAAGALGVVSGFRLIGNTDSHGGVNLGDGTRLTDNDLTCPTTTAESGCALAAGSAGVEILGNFFHDSATEINGAGSKLFHSIYLGEGYYNANYQKQGSDHDEVAWNDFINEFSAYTVQDHPTGGWPAIGVSIHDNYFDTIGASAIALTGMDTAYSEAKIYNNIIANAGAPRPYNLSTIGGPICSDINLSDASDFITVNRTPSGMLPGHGVFSIYNNTIYQPNPFVSDCYLGSSDNQSVVGDGSNGQWTAYGANFDNNVIDVGSGLGYFSTGQLGTITGSNNLYYGGCASSCTISTLAAKATVSQVTTDPLLNAPGSGNFGLQSGSPAFGAGTSTLSPRRDFMGVRRGNPPSIGAFETAPSNYVSLNWKASPGAMGYNVYRLAGTCPTGTPTGFSQIGSGLAVTNFRDVAVSPGSAYCYYATATNGSTESAPSNTGQVSVP